MLDQHTINLLERLVMAIEDQNEKITMMAEDQNERLDKINETLHYLK